jgi:hypothetical protein
MAHITTFAKGQKAKEDIYSWRGPEEKIDNACMDVS